MIVASLYGTVSSTSSTANNLLYLAMNYKSFKSSDYIIFQDGQYSYYIVWGDLELVDGEIVENSDIEYIHYYRSDSSSGYNYTYLYEYGTDTNFSLVLDDEFLTTSNMEGVGFVSLTGTEYEYYAAASDLSIFSVALLFAIMLCVFRGTSK